MKTIIQTTGFLLSIMLFTSANGLPVDINNAALGSLSDSETEITFKIISGSGVAAPATIGEAPDIRTNIAFEVNLQGFVLKDSDYITNVTGAETYFRADYLDDGSIPIVQLSQIAPYPGEKEITVTIIVVRIPALAEVGYFINPVVNNGDDTSSAAGIAPDGTQGSLGKIGIPIGGGGGGGVNQPNYGIGMDIARGGNNLGAVPSKMLPLEITVTNNIASADNTGPVVVALAKDSRLALATTCTPTNWTKTENSVAYLFTYANTDGSNTFAPDPTKTDSTIVCPVTVTRPTTQSGKLQLNAVLRHGSGDTKTSNDVASIEVTYN